RHCPKCQVQQREKWIQARTEQVLPVTYFHVVFTLPSELNQLCLKYPKQLYNTLFSASWKTIQTFSNDSKYLGAKTGMISLLHTWGQNISLHPHLHCLVPSGGVNKQQKWKQTCGKGKYLFPVKAMSKVFRAIFLKQLKQLKNKKEIEHLNLQNLVDTLFNKSWVVYAKSPCSGVKSVL
ncbi:transposase, partial [Aquimarina sp. RZ0]|uniref:IS91 family transposase n=1 Tax=Aquimarina sp. RZ0 TaxID=2607730 RepID=UPI0011F37A08